MVCLAKAQAVVAFGLGMRQTLPLPDEILTRLKAAPWEQDSRL